MLNGNSLGPLAPLLAADKNGREAYLKMSRSEEFMNPVSWEKIDPNDYDGILLPGGHAPGMREYLESKVLQKIISIFFETKKPVGAICHGVILAARSPFRDGKSVLFGRKTTALLIAQEITAWILTCLWLGNYYRTYIQPVEAEVKQSLMNKEDFIKGPLPLLRDSPNNLSKGFVVLDSNYLSARWPGDAHLFGYKFASLLNGTNSEK
jgi:protease I